MKRFVVALIALLALIASVAMADTLTLPDDLTTIEAEAFYGADAEIIIVPEGVMSIGSRAFGGSTSLKEVRVSTSADLRISDDALEGSPNAKFVSSDASWDGVYKYSISGNSVIVKKYMGMKTGTLEIPSELGGKSITTIGPAFLQGRTDFTKVVIPEGVTFIEANAFRDCANLTDITFPSTLANFYPRSSFAGCGSAAMEPFYFILPDNIKETVSDDAGTHGFTDCNAVLVCNPRSATAYRLGGYMTFPGQYDYRYRYVNNELRLMKYVGTGSVAEIPSDVELAQIYKNAFEDSTNLTKVVIPEGVTFIEEYAFKGCSNLTDVTFPSTLTRYYANSFDGCGSNATETFYFVLPDNITTTIYGDATTHNCFTNCKAVVECNPGSTTAYSMVSNCYITFPGLHDYRFIYNGSDHILWLMAYVGSDAEIVLPSSDEFQIEILNDGLFKDCNFLTKIVIPEGVRDIRSSVFENCINLAEVSLPSTVEAIREKAFRHCGEVVAAETERVLALRLPSNISTIIGYGDAAETEEQPSNATFKHCGFALIATHQSTTAQSLKSAHFIYYTSYNAETGELGDRIPWNDD